MDKINPLVTIHLDKERHLKLTLGGMREYLELTGRDILTQGIDLFKLPPADLQRLFWICLKHEDKELTEEMVGELFDTKNVITDLLLLFEAIKLSLPDSIKPKEAKDKSPLEIKTPPTG